ncbi:MAG: peptidase S41 [Chloroflexi bacterium]|nr:MAG: peptidase S41 [Chloroflexota bacterium]MBL1193788.1 peptidase S41 [Chloroflexota bacterium]NOH11081.1 peptidase S41 [Chloroflexota bacterium]
MSYRPLVFVVLIASLLLSACSGTTDQPTGEAEDTTQNQADSVGEIESQFELAEIQNDEGGPVTITGEVAYTNPFFTAGVGQPLVILEDQAGFVDRDRGYIMPPESQTIGQITSDFYNSPFTYSISLPIEPEGGVRDVDNDGEIDTGVLVFAPAYWTNAFGDPFLERRDLHGGGWSGAYVSTKISEEAATELEYIGGKIIIYAFDSQQGFPSGFGEDNMLFTEDDPIVGIPQGYTMVDMDSDPFIFDRSREVVMDLLEPEGAALDDFSDLNYLDAFDEMLAMMREEYSFTELKDIDWDAKEEEFRPRFAEAASANDGDAYSLAMRDFLWSIPDAHIGFSFTDSLVSRFFEETGGGLGMAIRETDAGTVIVNFLTPDGPAELAGVELGAEITELNGQPVGDIISAAVPWSSPFSTQHALRLQQLRYAVRFPLGTEVEVTYQNPDGAVQTITLVTSEERNSFDFSSFNARLSGTELPVEFQVLDGGIGYVAIYSFFDNEVLTVQLWERMIQTMNTNNIPALIIDMRTNGGGFGFLADQMAAYFFTEELELGNTALWDESIGDFYVDPNTPDVFYPPREELRYSGQVAVLVGPSCSSACEFFSNDMTLQDRAIIVGQYPTGGLAGSVKDFNMPDGITVRFSIGRPLDLDGNIIIEGVGVVPDVVVPVTEETLFSEGDPVLEAAIQALLQP